ncbi:MAG: PqqD family protein [Acidobacteria bacterium]|nr:MAG: PqqD family protein [Acidobacteriota bacterium]PYS85501.1 MAG: PqqD family protein [Acidobacteriota bacterium]
MSTTEMIPHEHVVFTEFDGGEGVLVDLDTKKYFQLNPTATLVWRGLVGGKTLEEIVGDMTAEYDVSPEHAAQSVQRLLRSLENFRLVRQG